MFFQGPSLTCPARIEDTRHPLPLPLLGLSQSSFLVDLLDPRALPSPWTLTAPQPPTPHSLLCLNLSAFFVVFLSTQIGSTLAGVFL